jgi:hypothetical protein
MCLYERDPATCDHTIHLPDCWVEWEDSWTGEMMGEWEYNRTKSAENDLDLHRTKCSLCGKIGYYSGAARKYYEEGIRTPGVTGLE